MNERLFSDEIRARERRRRRRDFVWNVVSFVLHVIVFGAIVLLTPVKSLVFEEKAKANPAAELSADRIEQIADALSQAEVIGKVAGNTFRVTFDYMSMNGEMKVLKDLDLPQSGQDFGEKCSLVTRVRLAQDESFKERLLGIAELKEI